ncbi:hypothetical protein AJ79_09306 [Helicocarpus griseus UAMH5409]|uniref:Uncharacterized protein n=1 Tax=Helicocarpus griseus UAMH5409 TaxID=1447875 RepID=A0A2B7WKW5_9EURO|nr:hypothetical protein AJ79_09306 [Helicocarpus griseus UAMH5409]
MAMVHNPKYPKLLQFNNVFQSQLRDDIYTALPRRAPSLQVTISAKRTRPKGRSGLGTNEVIDTQIQLLQHCFKIAERDGKPANFQNLPHSPMESATMSNALSLTGLETLSPSQKTQRIAAVANDMMTSIIYIAKQAGAGNLTAKQIAPIHDLIDKVNMVGREHNRQLEMELEEQDRLIEEMRRNLDERDERIVEMEVRHREEMRRVRAGRKDGAEGAEGVLGILLDDKTRREELQEGVIEDSKSAGD